MELSNFILLYFKTKGVSLITAFLCWSPEQQLDLWRAGQAGGVRVRASAGDAELPAYDVWREGVVADVACGFTPQLLQKASDSRSFNLRHTWLLLHDAPYNSSYLEDLLAESLILPDADVLWSSHDVLAEVYRVKAGQPLLKTEFDYTENITSEELLRRYAKISSTVSRRKDLQRIYLKSATIITQPQHFKGWSDVSNRYVDNFPKLTYPLMMDLARDLNFRYNMLQVDLYGEENNRTFDGLAGRLERNEIEIGICSMFMRKDRWRVMHFCSEVTDLRGAFMFRQPSKSTVSNMFLLPFSRGVWCASAGVFLGVALLLAGLSRHLRTFDDALGRLTAMETFTFALGTVCQQGFHIIPELASVRIVMFFTLITSVFVFTAYSAKIVAILQTPSDSIQTIADITSSPMAVGVQETTYKRVYFAESTEPATQLLYRKKLLPLGDRAYMSAVEGINRMRTGLFAFQAEEGSGYDIISKTFTESEKCGLKQIQAFRLPMVAVPIRKHSGYKELLAVRFGTLDLLPSVHNFPHFGSLVCKLRWYREAGMLSRERRVWLAEKPRCDAGGGGGFVSVGLRDVLPAGRVLLLGHAAATAALLAERALHRLTLKKRSLENII